MAVENEGMFKAGSVTDVASLSNKPVLLQGLSQPRQSVPLHDVRAIVCMLPTVVLC